jgi:hypothetical protein
MPCPQNGEDLLLSDDETGSTTNPDTDGLFDYSDNKTDATSDTDTASLLAEIDSDTNDDALLFEDEVQHSPKHYLTAAAKLNVQRLQQRRYNPKTQKQLD